MRSPSLHLQQKSEIIVRNWRLLLLFVSSTPRARARARPLPLLAPAFSPAPLPPPLRFAQKLSQSFETSKSRGRQLSPWKITESRPGHPSPDHPPFRRSNLPRPDDALKTRPSLHPSWIHKFCNTDTSDCLSHYHGTPATRAETSHRPA